jgi:hypothetical protein
MYMSLVNYLENDTWDTKFVNSFGRTVDLVDAKSFKGGFAAFFQFSTERFHNRETCDCYRTKGENYTYLQTQRETRYYANPETNNYVSYFIYLGKRGGASGLYAPQDAFRDTNSTYLNKAVPAVKWKISHLPTLINDYIAKMIPKPQFFLFNIGIWDTITREELLEIRTALVRNDLIGIFKTTTKQTYHERGDQSLLPHEHAACEIFPCLHLGWTGELDTAENYWDRYHFYGKPYGKMNVQLFDFLEVMSAAMP